MWQSSRSKLEKENSNVAVMAILKSILHTMNN